ncbi:hypothetical protein C8R44DRAFT_107602 [Mycena epipterygia]|nr:hypothetical protein C8R44DRAFT_107602 [Mycena epipterygia]
MGYKRPIEGGFRLSQSPPLPPQKHAVFHPPRLLLSFLVVHLFSLFIKSRCPKPSNSARVPTATAMIQSHSSRRDVVPRQDLRGEVPGRGAPAARSFTIYNNKEHEAPRSELRAVQDTQFSVPWWLSVLKFSMDSENVEFRLPRYTDSTGLCSNRSSRSSIHTWSVFLPLSLDHGGIFRELDV